MCTKLELCSSCYKIHENDINLKHIHTTLRCFGGYFVCDGCGKQETKIYTLEITNEKIEKYSDPNSEFSPPVITT